MIINEYEQVQKSTNVVSDDLSGSGVKNLNESDTVDDERIKPDIPDPKMVKHIINESDDMITAVESVAAMYGIPSSHITADPTATSLSVIKDNIVVPTETKSKPSENGKAIVQSIGAVLDYISQRVDNKLNDFQIKNKNKGMVIDSINSTSDPAKGKVISRHVDSNGDEILVYDSGLVDLPNSKEGQKKVDELRAIGKIPEYKYDPDEYYKKTPSSSYFTAEDDLMNGVSEPNIDIPVTPTNNIQGSDSTGYTITNPNIGVSNFSDKPESLNVAESIGESYEMIDMLSSFNDTRHLGYDIMKCQGFNFIKPIDFIQESENPTSSGIEHMKFDNTNILKAIKLMNMVRAKQGSVHREHLDIASIVNDPNYQKAIDCLNKQFNMRLNVRWISKEKVSNAATVQMDDVKTHLTISKSKGFQLGGLPIDVFVIGPFIEKYGPSDPELFGQHLISTLCHEIFHNIIQVIGSVQLEFHSTLAITMSMCDDIPSAKIRRKLITNFVNSIDEIQGVKLDRRTRKALIKNYTYLSAIAHDTKALKEYNDNITDTDKIIDRKIDGLKRLVRRGNSKANPIRFAIASACIVTLGILGLISGNVGAGIIAMAAETVLILPRAHKHDKYEKIRNAYKAGDIQNYQEYWCDLFAMMYSLPPTFFFDKNHRITFNDVPIDKLKEYNDLEREAYSLLIASYPTTAERNYASLKYAKKILSSGVKLDPSIKKYLEWIVDNNKNLEKLDIENIYNKATFDPKEVEDLDRHIDTLISGAKNPISITEYDLSWLKVE